MTYWHFSSYAVEDGSVSVAPMRSGVASLLLVACLLVAFPGFIVGFLVARYQARHATRTL